MAHSIAHRPDGETILRQLAAKPPEGVCRFVVDALQQYADAPAGSGPVYLYLGTYPFRALELLTTDEPRPWDLERATRLIRQRRPPRDHVEIERVVGGRRRSVSVVEGAP